MPSLTLGKLLSSSASKSTAVQDVPIKKSRGRSASDKKPAEQVKSLPELPMPSYGDRSTSDSYFTAVKRKNSPHAQATETDDYGFPVTDLSTSPLGLDDQPIEHNKPMVRGRCRICERSFQTTATTSYLCEHCLSHNLLGNAPRNNLERVVRPIAVTRIQDLIDAAIKDGLKRMDERRRESSLGPGPRVPIPPSPGRPNITSEPRDGAEHDVLRPPRPPFQQTRRRGSAPDAEIPSLNGPRAGHGRLRRKSPGPLPMNDIDHLMPNGSGHPHAMTPGPPPIPPPWLNDVPSPRPIQEQRRPRDPLRECFRPIFDMLADLLRRERLNVSFSTIRRHQHGGSVGENTSRTATKKSQDIRPSTPPPKLSLMDHKDLMVGDVYDIASSLVVTERSSPSKRQQSNVDTATPKLVSQGSPHIDWKLLQKWYSIILGIGLPPNSEQVEANGENGPQKKSELSSRHAQILEDLGLHLRSYILELTEHLLTSAQKAPESPEDIRYLMILLANPLLINPDDYPIRPSNRSRSATLPLQTDSPIHRQKSPSRAARQPKPPVTTSKQIRVLSLLLATMSNLSLECHNHIISWLTRYPEEEFRSHVDALIRYTNDRISHRHVESSRPRKPAKSETYNGIPTSQMFNDAIQPNVRAPKEQKTQEWQLRAGCKVLQFHVRANDHFHRKAANGKAASLLSSTRKKPMGKQLIATEYFYNSQLDSETKFNPRRDFDEWERKEPGLQLSQYPFLLTLGTKIQILEFDARKKMASKARQEFFDALLRNTSAGERFFHLKVRRNCIIEDSLQRISEAINSSEEEAKKALKVQFDGEEGVDAGGPRKEWFLLLVKELLDPEVGLFLYNEETNYCYFNPNSLESSEQYQLIGAVLGLAIYNFTILDVPFPPFLFRKLAAAAPPTMGADIHQGWRPAWRPELNDLSQFDPTLSKSLQHILDYEGNLADDIGAVFQIDTYSYGRLQPMSLVPGGENRIVNKKNREEYVDLYVDFLLDRSVRKQFEPFARGFYNVCGGNALSLFRGEEIELLIRGSGELDFSILRGAAAYENWKDPNTGVDMTSASEIEAAYPVIAWFWDLMSLSDVSDQRRVLRWITGSDRIPATGIGSLVLKIQCLGDDCERLPQSRTCFNMLQLWNYTSRGRFIRKFWFAVVNSEGFGLK